MIAYRNFFKRLMAITLTVTLMVPSVLVFAEEPPLIGGELDFGAQAEQQKIVITNFATPTELIEVPLGTAYDALDLPDTLPAEVSGETTDVPVEWIDDGGYDGDKEDGYEFTGSPGEAYVLAEGALAPKITVNVCGPVPDDIITAFDPISDDTITAFDPIPDGIITAFDPIPDDVRFQSLYMFWDEVNLPDTLSAQIGGETKQVPVTWRGEPGYDAENPEEGLYVYIAEPSEGFDVAGGVDAPRISVFMQNPIRPMSMGGNGSEASPLEISTAAQLAEIAALVNANALGTYLGQTDSHLKLMNDIDLSDYGENYNGGKGWIPIGYEDFTTDSSAGQFVGSFDGGGNKITGLFINAPVCPGGSDMDRSFATGLFGYVPAQSKT